jgi:flagellar protein FlgJ
MAVNSLGAAYVDDYRLASPAKGITGRLTQNGAGLSEGKSFAEILEKTREAPQTSAAPGGSASSGGSAEVVIDKTGKLYEMCLELETFLVKNLISGMRNTVQKSGLVDEGFAGKMYEDMLYDEYAKDFTKNAGFGLAEQAYLELSGQRGKALIRS